MLRKILENTELNNQIFQAKKNHIGESFFVETKGAILSCYYQRRNKKALTLIFFHGSDESVADYLNFFGKYIQALQYNVFLVEYRGFGKSTGQPNFSSILEDIPYIFSSLNVNPKKAVVMGRSIGSLFALDTIRLFPEIKGLILESAIADMFEYLLSNKITIEDPKLLRTATDYFFDNTKKIADYSQPVLILHGLNDMEAKLWHAQELYRHCKSEKSLKIFEHGGHKNLMIYNWKDYLLEVYRFLWKLEQ